MPLSPVSPAFDRQRIHTRLVECQGYGRNDGLFDIEGHLVDIKDYDFPNQFRGEIKKGEPIHDMWIRLTIDEDLIIHHVEVTMDAVPYAICPQITSAFEILVGRTIGPGWSRVLRRSLGGINGCTHLGELLKALATVAFQTIIPARQRREKKREDACDHDKTRPDEAKSQQKKEGKPPQIDSCHAYASDGEVVKTHWPRFFTGARETQAVKARKKK